MGQESRRRNHLRAVNNGTPPAAEAPAGAVCYVMAGPGIEQTTPDGVVLHVQYFHVCDARGRPLVLKTDSGEQVPFILTAAPIPVRRTVLAAPGARMVRR